MLSAIFLDFVLATFLDEYTVKIRLKEIVEKNLQSDFWSIKHHINEKHCGNVLKLF